MSQWNPFEEFVIKELNSISARLSTLEAKSKVSGAIAGAVVAVIIEFIAGIIRH